MTMILGVPLSLLMTQIVIGLMNGAFYALLSLGLAVIFGLLNIINFAHGAFFMLGALAAWALLEYFGLGFWYALVVAPLGVALFGVVLERSIIRRLYDIDHIYGLLLTLGMTLVIEGVVRNVYGSTGMAYPQPQALSGGVNLGFMFLPYYRTWVVAIALVACLGTWIAIERTTLGAKLRAVTENAPLVQAFGVNVPLMVTITYGAGIGLAAFAGVLAAPLYSVNPNMGTSIIIVVFAVVVIGGMGFILGAIITGFSLGLLEGIVKAFYPEGSSMVVFIAMILVLLARPTGLFGKAA